MGMGVGELYGTFIDDSQNGALGGEGKGNMPDESGNSGVGLSPVMWMLFVLGMLVAIRLLSDYNN